MIRGNLRYMDGQLYLAATPIGNYLDSSLRLQELLTSADLIAAEDTRKVKALCARLGITPRGKVISFHDHNEEQKSFQIIAEAQSGQIVLMVTDAGMPTVSDPGYKLIQKAIELGCPFEVIPGPSAVTMALALSGLATDRFSFEGFVPRKSGERVKTFNKLRTEERTMVFFESPHRLLQTLLDAASVFGGDKQVAVCRELTKKYEETVRGTLAEVVVWAKSKEIKGEICFVVSGNRLAPVLELEDLIPRVAEQLEKGVRLKAAVSTVSAEFGVSKRELYELMLAHKES